MSTWSGAETGIHLRHAIVRAEEEPTRHEEHRSQRELRGDEPRQRPTAAGPGRRPCAGLVHGPAQVAADRVECRRPAEEHGRQRGDDEGERCDAHVEVEVRPRRDLIAGARDQEPQRPVAGEKACRAAQRGQHDVLDEQLLREPRPARADSEPDAHLAPPRERPREHHAGDVGAGDDEQDRDRAEEGSRLGAEVTNQVLAQRLARTARRCDRCRACPKSAGAPSTDPSPRLRR